eukprot:1085943-Amorphochlora_amoeboformis.AAC.1
MPMMLRDTRDSPGRVRGVIEGYCLDCRDVDDFRHIQKDAQLVKPFHITFHNDGVWAKTVQT